MKKFLKLFSVVALIFCCMFSFVGCNIFEKDKKDDDTILFLDGSSVVMSLEEAESLLSQAKANTSGALLLSTNLTPAQYTKSDLLLIINQIKSNIINATRLSFYYEYENNPEMNDRGVVAEDLRYFHTVEGDNVYESWEVKENGNQPNEYTEYVIETTEGQEVFTKSKYIEDEGINVEQFCQYKFSFMIPEIEFNESYIEGGYVHNNNLYIKLHMDEINTTDSNLNETFVVKNGYIVTDKLSWLELQDDGVERTVVVTQSYAWNNDVNASLFQRANNIPEDVSWQEVN